MAKYAKQLANNLQQLVAARFPSQSAFAKAAKLTQSQANLYIRGEALPKLDNLENMADALGVSVAALIGDEKPVAAPPRAPTDVEFLAALVKRYELKPKMKEALLAILELDEIAIDARLPSILAGKRRGTASDNKKSGAG